ncbi:MAG TPA: alpha/beta fold hydrolase [Baekduia sp.]|nr:alpha/beta fold hydrolase [Baekduia sp.]HMJ36164.1 alpha/beta fold hydrolase [Baekduia sp.]
MPARKVALRTICRWPWTRIDKLQIADAMGIARFAVMGASGGGPHALACAALLGDRVVGAVCLAGLAPSTESFDWFAGMASDWGLRAAVAGRGARERYEASAQFDESSFTPADWAALDGAWSSLGADAGRAAAAGPDGLIDDDLAFVAPWGFDVTQIAAPVLIVQGGADRVVPPAHADWLLRSCRGSELWLRPDDGHISVLDACPVDMGLAARPRRNMMRKLIYSMGVSLDGFIAGPDGAIDWSAPDEELHRFHNQQTLDVGAHLLGRRRRRLYEDMLPWETADEDPSAAEPVLEFAHIWQSLPKIVFSKTLGKVEGNARLASDGVAEEVARLKEQPGKDLAIGGAGLASAAIALGLVDEFRLFVSPVVLGGGTPYFPAADERIALELVETQTFGSRVVYLRYRRVAGAPFGAPGPNGRTPSPPA